MSKITETQIAAYVAHLTCEEKAHSTIKRYSGDVKAFAVWLNGMEAVKETACAYKRELSQTRKATGVNVVISALNSFFAFSNSNIKLKPLKIQRQVFRKEEKELNRTEYYNLLKAAKSKNDERLCLVIQTICATGIRVSELKYIKVEALKTGRVEILSKGKVRLVFLPDSLRKLLKYYSANKNIRTGSIFITKSGNPLDRSNVWADMKALCECAGVLPTKVFPHNLRHLFARTFYKINNDILRLADILGHADINTTRIYTIESGHEHKRRIEKLGLVLN